MKTIDDIIKAKAKQAVEDAFQEFINSVVQMKDDKPKRVQKYCRICHKLECDCLIKSMEGMVIESSKDERLREDIEELTTKIKNEAERVGVLTKGQIIAYSHCWFELRNILDKK